MAKDKGKRQENYSRVNDLRRSCIALATGAANEIRFHSICHAWLYGFAHCRTDDGKVFSTLNILDECRRACLTIRVCCGDQLNPPPNAAIGFVSSKAGYVPLLDSRFWLQRIDSLMFARIGAGEGLVS